MVALHGNGLPSAAMGFTILVLVIYVLAVARLVRLVNFDTVLDPVRVLIARRAALADRAAAEAGDAGREASAELYRRRAGRWNTLAYFVACPWCVGFWLALATAPIPVGIMGWPWWAVFGVALAASHVVGLMAPLSADEEIEIVEA
ncbi:hypothetical protein KEK_08252 [Mycolicibacterium thermoresistibile ATCC 19527]|uniref:Uncharacterized protein n=3 Tax=Mycolicibacterium thermoresistibile TaxID=1797 RepID=G7CF79_MYCT3|nr:hypothetical protein KEK_08252 [Mycolicibacterium thermoresistibile ATCC 19527]GAT16282.1 putative uncharacterized protein [Mycolicibacterium thermoresistibile]SNW20348.1 Protein of uncharacterised function (DUF1360) [Mycolicibacterium thermoresistibile]